MANIKQQVKRNRKSEEERVRNMGVRTRMRNTMKQALQALEAKDAESVKEALPKALSAIDKAATKGVIHRNSAARKKSTLDNLARQLG
jgi:small subunit ribosomal protein S20